MISADENDAAFNGRGDEGGQLCRSSGAEATVEELHGKGFLQPIVRLAAGVIEALVGGRRFHGHSGQRPASRRTYRASRLTRASQQRIARFLYRALVGLEEDTLDVYQPLYYFPQEESR